MALAAGVAAVCGAAAGPSAAAEGLALLQSPASAGFPPVLTLASYPSQRLDRLTTVHRQASKNEKCRRWLTAIESLGETFAGYELRRAVRKRHCASVNGDDLPVGWTWPWHTIATGFELPPVLYRSYKSWTIRCGTGENRDRCALLSDGRLTRIHERPQPQGAQVLPSIHFVIDRVAGREMLLWRLYVPMRTAARSSVADTPAGAASPQGASPAAHQGTATVRVRFGRRKFKRHFTVCNADGCLLELNGRMAGALATRLADGLPEFLVVETGDKRQIRIVVAANGFRGALAELGRLRHAERRDRSR
ncbi:MAG: hypothetical protein ACK5JT_23220 [Hyphomicrobiaceae bacterium]